MFDNFRVSLISKPNEYHCVVSDKLTLVYSLGSPIIARLWQLSGK